MAFGAARQETQGHGVKSGKKPRAIPKGDIMALLDVCLRELEVVNDLLQKLALTTARDRKDQTETLTRVLCKKAQGDTASLWNELRALSQAMITYDQRIATVRAELTIAMIELRARIRHHFYRTFETPAKSELNPVADDEDAPLGRCCMIC